MRIKLFAFLIVAYSICFGLDNTTLYSNDSFAPANECQYNDLNSLQGLLSKAAKDFSILWKDQKAYSSSSSVYDDINKCWGKISNFGISACFVNLKNYSFRMTSSFNNNHRLGFNQTDSEYLSGRMKYLALPSEFSDGLPENWQALAAQKGWKVLSYRSRILPNPPHNQYSRILFYIPLPEYDQWIQFTTPDVEDVEFKQSTLIDMISVTKVENGMTLEKPQINFIQYERNRSGKNPQVRAFFDRCIRCHPSGLRNINPMIGSLESNESLRTALEYNKIINDYGQISWGKSLFPEKLSPPYGKIEGKNSCFECHNNYQLNDGTSKGMLTAFSERDQFAHKMLVELTMSPENKKDPEYKDFFEVIKKIRVLDVNMQKELYKNSKIPDNITLIEFAKSKGIISESERQLAISQYSQLIGKQTKLLEQLNTTFEKDLELWLLGGKENCVK